MNESLLFTHNAMNCTFTLRMASGSAKPWESIAQKAWSIIDYLESQLSCFLEDSEVSQINQMKEGDSLFICDALYRCLKIGIQAYGETFGVFDITLGKSIEAYKTQENKSSLMNHATEGSFVLDSILPKIYCQKEGKKIDLGAIGKGFAVDEVINELSQYGLSWVLVSSGASTHRVWGDKQQEFILENHQHSEKILLHNQSLAASSDCIQGSHIIHPYGLPYESHQTWCVANTATLADIWSTAAMLLPEEALEEAVQTNPDLIAFYRMSNSTEDKQSYIRKI